MKNTNELHELYYGKGQDRRFPKKGTVSTLSQVSAAAKWLRNRKKQLNESKN